MMDYDKIYERVVRRGDAILEERRKKAVKIRQTSYAVSGVCAAVITGVGIWRMNDLKKLPDNRISEIETVEDITTTNTDITAAVTETSLTYTETSKKTTISKTTSSTSAVTSESRTSTTKSTTASETSLTDTYSDNTTSYPESVNTTISTETEAQTEKVNETTTLQTSIMEISSEITAKTTKTTVTSVEMITEPITYSMSYTHSNTTTIPTKSSETTSSMSESQSIVDVESPELIHDPSVFNIIEFPNAESTDFEGEPRKYRYTGEKVDEDMISALKNTVHLKKPRYSYGNKSEIETTASIYKLRYYSYDAVIAVRFEGDYNYYKYIATSYDPENLSELISAFYLTADSLSDECKYWSSIIPDINKTEAWKMLTSDISLTNIREYCEEHKITLYPDLKFTFGYSQDSWFKGTIGIDSLGYMIIKVDNMTDAVFFIGEDKAEEIISVFTN